MKTLVYRFVALLCLSSCGTAACAADESPALFMKVISLKNANCVEMDSLLTRLFGQHAFSHAIDQRTNSVVVRGEEKAVELVDALLEKLDRPIETEPRPSKKKKATKTKGRQKVAGGAATLAVSPVSGTIQPLVAEGQHVKKGEVLAKVKASSQEQDPVSDHVADVHAEAQRAKERLKVESELHRAITALQLAEARLQHAHGEVVLEKQMLETELANALSEFEAIKLRSQLVEDRLSAGHASPADLGSLRADEKAVQRKASILERRIQLHSETGAKLRILELESQLEDAKAAVGELEQVKQQIAKRNDAARAAAQQRRQLIQARKTRAQPPEVQVVAPVDGAVVFLGPIKPGAQVRERQPLFQLTPSAP